ncbi:MAG: hypothetical protein HIU85_15850 [Proteobacteria bacterium]|nr:hypothetical protein [Pseudomonadota bacterium]
MIRVLKLWRLIAGDLRLLWFALRHQHRPIWLWPVAVVLGLYALDPVNFALPFAGIVDDLILIPLLVHLVVTLLPGRIKAGYALRARN